LDEKASIGNLILITAIQIIGKEAIKHQITTNKEDESFKEKGCFIDLVSIIISPLYNLPKFF
jgi:hypothetical protein